MSQSKSSPTYSAFAFDVPEPQFFDGSFVYNYFMKDERVTNNAYSDLASVQRNTPRSDFNPSGSPPGVPARKVVLEFTALQNITNLSDPFDTEQERLQILRKEAHKIVSEVEVQTERSTFISTQDDEIAASLQAIIDATLLQQKSEDRGLSPLEAVLKYNSLTSDKVNASDILETTDIEATSNLTYYDPATGEDLMVQQEGGVSKYAVGGFYNSKFVYDILASSENAPFSPLWGTVDSILEETNRIQLEAVSTLDSNLAYTFDYEFSVTPISAPQSITKGAQINSIAVCGYLIEKAVVNEDGSTTIEDLIPVASLESTQVEDDKIIYGKTYKYSIKSVFSLTTLASGKSTSSTNKLVTYLIASRGSPYIEISCNETVPPPPPENIQFYLSSEQNMLLFWDMPRNTQEDIKRFQIFRRLSLEEPYTLVAELDFDDSEILTERSEFVPSFTNQKKDGITLYYEDPDFEFDIEYYYAICSVDAHDLSSPYSSQFKVIYDRINAEMKTTLVGWPGAPKPYPNFTIKETLTIDCIKDSGHSKLKIYFDPECLILEGAEQSIDTGMGLKTSPWRPIENYIETNSGTLTGTPVPMYKMQIINLDRQQDQKLDIYLKRSPNFDWDRSDDLAGD